MANSHNNSRHTTIDLNIIIVGAGLGGLVAAISLQQAGHAVVLLETRTKQQLWSYRGGGHHISPNLAKVLSRWGLSPLPQNAIFNAKHTTLRRYAAGEHILLVPFNQELANECGGEIAFIGHDHLQRMLYDVAIESGVQIKLGERVVSIDPNGASVTLESGHTLKSDLIVGADGSYSTVRKSIFGDIRSKSKCAGRYVCFSVDTKLLRQDPELESLLENNGSICWMGPSAAVISYCISNRQQYCFNAYVDCPHPEDCRAHEGPNAELWTETPMDDNIKRYLSKFESAVQKLLNLTKSAFVTHYFTTPPLETWVREDRNVVLIGDAAHPSVPSGTKGYGMPMEDGAVLGCLFSNLKARSQIPTFLQTFEELRLERCSEASHNDVYLLDRMTWADGPAQETRDREYGIAAKMAERGEYSDEMAVTQDDLVRLWDYDAYEDVDNWWFRWGRLQEFMIGVPAPGVSQRRLSIGVETRVEQVIT